MKRIQHLALRRLYAAQLNHEPTVYLSRVAGRDELTVLRSISADYLRIDEAMLAATPTACLGPAGSRRRSEAFTITDAGLAYASGNL